MLEIRPMRLRIGANRLDGDGSGENATVVGNLAVLESKTPDGNESRQAQDHRLKNLTCPERKCARSSVNPILAVVTERYYTQLKQKTMGKNKRGDDK